MNPVPCQSGRRRVPLGASLVLSLALGGCLDLGGPPSAQDALQALHDMGQQLGVPTPPGFRLQAVQMKECQRQEQPEGYSCDVVLISEELPILGSMSLPMHFRFARRQGRWAAFLN